MGDPPVIVGDSEKKDPISHDRMGKSRRHGKEAHRIHAKVSDNHVEVFRVSLFPHTQMLADTEDITSNMLLQREYLGEKSAVKGIVNWGSTRSYMKTKMH